MRLSKQLLILLLAISISFGLLACGESLEELDGGYKASFRGHMVELNGEYAPLTNVYAGDNYLKLYEDGNGVIAFSGFEEEISWTKVNDSYSIMVQGEPCPATVSDGLLVMELEGAYVTYVAEGASAPLIPTTEAPNYDLDLSSPYGKYHGLTINQFGEVLNMTEFYSGECYIRLDDDGMGVLCLGGSEMIIAWELDSDTLTIADINGINSVGLLSEGVVVLDYMETGIQLAFAKQGAEP